MDNKYLEKSILSTICYFDIFEYYLKTKLFFTDNTRLNLTFLHNNYEFINTSQNVIAIDITTILTLKEKFQLIFEAGPYFRVFNKTSTLLPYKTTSGFVEYYLEGFIGFRHLISDQFSYNISLNNKDHFNIYRLHNIGISTEGIYRLDDMSFILNVTTRWAGFFVGTASLNVLSVNLGISQDL